MGDTCVDQLIQGLDDCCNDDDNNDDQNEKNKEDECDPICSKQVEEYFEQSEKDELNWKMDCKNGKRKLQNYFYSQIVPKMENMLFRRKLIVVYYYKGYIRFSFYTDKNIDGDQLDAFYMKIFNQEFGNFSVYYYSDTIN